MGADWLTSLSWQCSFAANGMQARKEQPVGVWCFRLKRSRDAVWMGLWCRSWWHQLSVFHTALRLAQATAVWTLTGAP